MLILSFVGGLEHADWLWATATRTQTIHGQDLSSHQAENCFCRVPLQNIAISSILNVSAR